MKDKENGWRIWTEIVNENAAVFRAEYAEQSFESSRDFEWCTVIPIGDPNNNEQIHKDCLDAVFYHIAP